MADEDPLFKGIPGEKICPRCRIRLHIVEEGDIKLDVCPDCGGIWFDRNELDEIVEDESIELLIEITGTLEGEGMLCPACREKMTTHEVFGVYVDHCQLCKGIWMDRGETEKIWEMDERSKHPFGIGVQEPRAKDFWKRFRSRYSAMRRE